MSPTNGEIKHVSDTALIVAACRALETESDDGFVHDPFAARLAGERGMAILRTLPYRDIMGFGLGVRSRFIDELLLDALSGQGIITVLSVGCGLDTRPWRLQLPPELRWIEVDFAAMLDYKGRAHGGRDSALPPRAPQRGPERSRTLSVVSGVRRLVVAEEFPIKSGCLLRCGR